MNRSHHIRMKLLLVAGDRTTNNVRSVVSISGGLGRPFNHGLRGAQPLYHHWTVSRANCGYISLSPWPAHCNDLLVCCRRSTDTKHGGRIGCIYNLYLILFKKKKRNHDRDGFVVLRPNIANDTVSNLMWFLTFWGVNLNHLQDSVFSAKHKFYVMLTFIKTTSTSGGIP